MCSTQLGKSNLIMLPVLLMIQISILWLLSSMDVNVLKNRQAIWCHWLRHHHFKKHFCHWCFSHIGWQRKNVWTPLRGNSVWWEEWIWGQTYSGLLPRWHSGKESASQCRRCWLDPSVRKIPSSVLAWRIPWTEELDGLLWSRGSQRIDFKVHKFQAQS